MDFPALSYHCAIAAECGAFSEAAALKSPEAGWWSDALPDAELPAKESRVE